MSENIILPSFASGELSPNLFARVDIKVYHSGAARMRNFFVDYRSGASTRPGTMWIHPCPDAVNAVRLVRFQQSVAVTYVLEFGNNYLRFISGGGSVVEPPFDITGVNFGVQTDIGAAGHDFNDDELVFVSGTSVRQLNNRYFLVTASAPDIFTALDPQTGAFVDSSTWDTWAGDGQVQRVFTLPTPWDSTMLATLKFSQKGSQMNITSPFVAPYVLTLVDALNWDLSPATFGSTVDPPTPVTAGSSTAGPAFYKYTVTAVDDQGQESQLGSIAHADNVLDLRTTSGSIIVSWNFTGTPFAFNVYGASPSLEGTVPDDTQFGFIGITNYPGDSFVDSNITPDFSQSPPISNNPFDPLGTDPFPQVSAYFQQRLVYANGGGNDTDRFWMSRPGAYYNFDISNPAQANDSIDARLVSLEVNEIKSMIPMPSGLVMLTTKGAWQVSGGAGGVATQGGPITPASITSTSQAYIGANDVPPILINYDIYFIQQKGSIVRNLSYNIYANIFTGSDISIMSSHLFYGHQILEWAYAEEPFKVVWAIREDGVLLSLTVIKEQEMFGWARHDTLGSFKSVCTVTEGTVDATYFVVDRPLADGTMVRQVERLAERTFPLGAEDSWCVDAGITSSHNSPAADLTIYLAPENNVNGGFISFGASADVFSPEMVGWVVRAGGGKAVVTDVASGAALSATVIQPFTNIIPNDPLFRPTPVPQGQWSIDGQFSQVFGLAHLEGQKVSVLADGGVVRGLVVSNGSITLPSPATNVIVGLGYQAQLQTMYLDLGQETNTVQGKRKKVAALTVRVKDSRGIKAGRTFGFLVPIKELNRLVLPDQPIPLITSDERIVMDPLWDVPGQICLQVDDPVPATVLGVIPEVVIGDTPK